MSFESQKKPTPSAAEYLEMEKGIKDKIAGPLASAPADQMEGIYGEIEDMEAERQGAYDAMYEDAHAENASRALEARRIAEIDSAIEAERGRLRGGSVEMGELSKVVQRIKELDAQKRNPTIQSPGSPSVESQAAPIPVAESQTAEPATPETAPSTQSEVPPSVESPAAPAPAAESQVAEPQRFETINPAPASLGEEESGVEEQESRAEVQRELSEAQQQLESTGEEGMTPEMKELANFTDALEIKMKTFLDREVATSRLQKNENRASEMYAFRQAAGTHVGADILPKIKEVPMVQDITPWVERPEILQKAIAFLREKGVITEEDINKSMELKSSADKSIANQDKLQRKVRTLQQKLREM